MTWTDDKVWADSYLSEVERVVRSVAGEIIEVRTASNDEDSKQVTDYVVEVSAGTIACRVRRPCNFRDLTLRSMRRSGVQTELHKIRDGWGRWYLYAWADTHGDFAEWVFIDLNLLRRSGLLGQPRKDTWNYNGDSAFRVYGLSELWTVGAIVHQGTTTTNGHLF